MSVHLVVVFGDFQFVVEVVVVGLSFGMMGIMLTVVGNLLVVLDRLFTPKKSRSVKLNLHRQNNMDVCCRNRPAAIRYSPL